MIYYFATLGEIQSLRPTEGLFTDEQLLNSDKHMVRVILSQYFRSIPRHNTADSLSPAGARTRCQIPSSAPSPHTH